MFLFILESIGTSELILIAVVALIVFGPRKLPQMVKTFGKTMSEFKSATNEFKSTWEKEASFELEEESKKKINSSTETSLNTETMISLEPTTQEFEQKSFPAPKIKQLPPEVIAQTFQNRELLGETKTESAENKIEKQTSDKRDWI